MADAFDSSLSYTGIPNPVQPTGIQDPASWDLNPEGSVLGAAPYSHGETDLIKRDIAYAIFDAVPAKYKVLRLLFDKPVLYKDGDEFTYMEKTFGRTALKVSDVTVASGATQTINLTTGGGANCTLNKILVYPDNTKGIVYEISGDAIKVRPYTGAANLSALAQNDYLSIQSGLIADGMNFLVHYDRMSKVERYNFIQLMQRDKRWTRKEIQKFINSGTTNYFELDKKEQMDLLLQDMFTTFWNGQRGEAPVSTPGVTGASTWYKGLTMGGIFPLMVAAGCANSSGVTDATLPDVFQQLAFQTNYKGEGGVRYIFGQDALLYALSKSFKEPGIRYTPNDKIADLNLMEYRFGDMRFVPVSVELFKEISMFPATWKHRLIILDLDTIQPVCMKGYLPIELGETNMKGENGSINDYKEWWIQGMLSLQFNNPLSSFYIDTTGIVS